MEILITFITWLVLSVIAGVIASNKGRSGFGFFLLAIILSPLIGILGALIVKENTEAVENQKVYTGNNKKCPFCAEIIKAEAKVCRYCGNELPVLELNIDENPLNNFDEVGNTPLMVAAVKGNLEKVKKLLNEGANPFIKNRSGMTAKNRANNLGHKSVVKLLEESESIFNKEI